MKKWTLSIGVLLFFGATLWSQNLCTGSLGENIFEDGDFGSGFANVLPTDPGIAPGYIYTLNVPPEDGFYTVTNNTGNWFGLFPTWMSITDNSSDPNGYMMVVNASFEPGIFYEEVIPDLCENTLYEFSADIINIIRPGATNHLLPRVSFLLDNQLELSTGDIGQTGTWRTYGFTFTTGPGQTQLRLALSNDAPGGFGNDLALDNIQFRACGPTARIGPFTDIDLCEDDAARSLFAEIQGNQFNTPVYQWQILQNGLWVDLPGATGTTIPVDPTLLGNGTYTFRYLLANSLSNLSSPKCRIVSQTKEVQVIPIRFTLFDTICLGSTFQLGEQQLSSTGVYRDSLLAQNGCDSLVTLNLEVLTGTTLEADIELRNPSCSGFTDGAILLNQVTGGSEPYRIEVLDSEQQLVADPEALGGGVYTVRVIDRFGCQLEEVWQLIDPLPLVLSLGTDTTLELGQSLVIQANTNFFIDNYQWQPPEILDCANCPAPAATPIANTPVQLIATDANGCSISDSIGLAVTEVRKVYIPNIFTPNDDGINDDFTVFVDPNNAVRIVSFRVFDRWGGLLYEAEDQAPNSELLLWNGTANGEALDEGVYVYFAEIAFVDGVVLKYAGDVALIR
ncbi:MAG: gliding motility-associated C-terminal domain-containing protein [Bacteroidota bacterium]